MAYESANVDPGASPTLPVAVDLVNGANVQVVKLDAGADGVSVPVTTTTGLPIRGDGSTLPVSAASLPLPAGAATDATLVAIESDTTAISAATGTTADGESASGNGTLVAILKRVRTLLAAGLPSALSNDRLKVEAAPQDAISATGSLTGSGQSVILTLSGQSAVAVHVTGTFVGTVTFEASIDGVNYTTTISGMSIAGGTATSLSTLSGQGEIMFPATGLSAFRVRCSAFTSGTINVTIRAVSTGVPVVGIVGGDLARITAGITPGTGATSLGKAEDAVHASGDVGILGLGVRNDAEAAFTSNDGDYSPIGVDLAGRVKISPALEVTGNAGAGLTALAQAYTIATPTLGKNTLLIQITGTFVATLTFEASLDGGTTWSSYYGSLASGGGAFLTATAPGILAFPILAGMQWRARVSAYTSGTVLINSVQTDKALPQVTIGALVFASGAFATSGTGAIKIEDNPASNGDGGIPSWAVRRDTTTASQTSASGDYSEIVVGADGQLGVRAVYSSVVTGAPTRHRLASAAASTNATSVKASAGRVYHVRAVNTNAAVRYLKFYDKATAPTVGTDVPIATIALPPNTVNGGLLDLELPLTPEDFATGIAYALTTGAPDTDVGALTAGDVILSLRYL